MSMTAERFNDTAQTLLNHRGWKRSLSRATGKNYATVKRWSTGQLPVPEYVEMILDLLAKVPVSQRPACFFAFRRPAVKSRQRQSAPATASAAPQRAPQRPAQPSAPATRSKRPTRTP